MPTEPNRDMKKQLARHVEELCQVVFNVLGIQSKPAVTIIDCQKEKTDATKDQDDLREYVVILDCTQNTKKLADLTQKLTGVYGKQTWEVTEKTKRCLCWYEGSPIPRTQSKDTERKTPKPPSLQSPPPGKGKINTALPNWLEKLLYDDLHATYNPDYQKFDYNLELTRDDLLVYLGTYFPRSYAEVFCIFDHLLSDRTVAATLKTRQDLSILDIGCGTGGDISGLLVAMAKHFPNIKTVELTTVDGNQDALDILHTVISECEKHTALKINLTVKKARIENHADYMPNVPPQIDIGLCCKAMNEVIKKGKGKTGKAYQNLLDHVADHLAPTGMFMLLDVTTKTEHSGHYPFLLNQQVNEFTRTNPTFRTLLPLPCSYHEQDCNSGCFSQRQFEVTCKGKDHVTSRVAYRIIARRTFVDNINGKETTKRYHFPRPDQDSGDLRVCTHGNIVGDHHDAYTLATAD